MRLYQTLGVVLTLAGGACSADATHNPMAPTGLQRAATDGATDATKTLNIHGTLQTSEIDGYDPATNSLLVHLTGSGAASLLGRFTMVDDGVASLTTGAGTGTITYTAADGSSFTGTASGNGTIDGDFADLADTLTVTGGTGRFAGASGILIANRRLDLTTLSSSGSINGSLSTSK
jgi:hypothetical protein